MNFVLIGQPGSGKGTQAERMMSQYNLLKISTGDILRSRIKEGDETAKKLSVIISSGSLVGDDIMLDLLIEVIEKNISKYKGFIFDGFPRNDKQAIMMEKILSRFSLHLDAVIFINVDRDNIIERLSGRYMCSDCGSSYHKIFLKTSVEGVCDKCGSHNLIVRADDAIDVINKRFDAYQNETSPLIDHYRKLQLLHEIDGNKSPEDVSISIDELVKSIV